jgi:U3 small nucleolar RNA-associated protein 20
MLPEMVIRNEGVPAMLVLLQTLSSDPALIHLLSAHDEAVLTVLKCIAGTTMPASMNVILTFVENLLTITDTGKGLIRKYTPQLMDQFTIRLSCSSTREEEDAPTESTKKTSPKISGSRFPTWRRELEILFCVSQFVTEGDFTSEPAFVKSLCSLLVPFLRPDQKTSDEDKTHVLGILHFIYLHVDQDAALSMYLDLGAILGPYKTKEGIKTLAVRRDIASLIDMVSNNQLSHLKNISSLLRRMCSINAKRVDEMDFEMVIPALNVLGEEKQWQLLCNYESDPSKGTTNPTFLLPIINTLFHYLHHDDGVVARGAFHGLKVLVSAASVSGDDEWIKLIGSSIIPMLKKGLQCRNGAIRRSYILLIRDVSVKFHDNDSPCLCGDLNAFIDKENEDLDVFIGLTHLQLHRRTRAFTRLRKIINNQQDKESGQGQVSSQSMSSVLLPLALHPVYESKQKADEAFALEAIATIGALSRHLSWNKYNNILSSILSQLDRQPEQERYLVGGLCAIIDGFNFELIKPNDDEDPSKSSVWRALEKRIVPKLESKSTKESTDKNGTRVKSLRPSILLALMKLFQKFPTEFFAAKLPRLLTVICDALRSKDSNERDVGRTTLAKMVCAMDLKYLSDVIRELAVTLTDGYKLHVRAATIHTILLELSKCETDESIAIAPHCVGGLMDLIQDDLFGEANDRRESTETNVRYVKEAGGNKSEHSVSEILSTRLCTSSDWLKLI